MKRKKIVSIILSAVMVVNSAMPAFADERAGAVEIPEAILEFTFNENTFDKDTGKVTSETSAGTVEADSTNIEFAKDELGNEIAVFSLGKDGKVPNIKYTSDDNDPLKKLEDGKGATVSAWIKTVGGDFQDTIFYYGKDSAVMHSSLQVLAQNDTKKNDGGARAFYYRGAEGSTGSSDIFDETGKRIAQQKASKIGNAVYKDDVWQLVTYVEGTDGSGTLYVDGEVNAEWKNTVGNKARSLFGYIHDGTPDVCYIGAKPGLAEEYFIGGMDSFSVYDEPLTQQQVQKICSDFKNSKLEDAKTAFGVAKKDANAIFEDGQGKYSTTSWTAFTKEVSEANSFNGTTLDDYTRAYEELKRAQSGLTRTTSSNEPVVEFNFSNVKQSGNDMEVTGITGDGTEVTATAKGINFRDGVAIFPQTSSSIRITYEPTSEDDPMKNLGETDGATIAIWLKTWESEFTSSLFAYGATRQDANGEEIGLGRSIHIMGRNGLKSGEGTVFYREKDGKTDVYDQNSEKIGNQKINQGKGFERPYKVSTWQLLTYVEEKDGNGVLYLDGKEIGKYGVEEAKTKLFQYAKDEYGSDKYLIGYLPYEADDGDTHFVGEMDSVAVYKKAMNNDEVDNLYEIKMLEDAIKAAEKLEKEEYEKGAWNEFQAALQEAKGVDLDTANTSDIEEARNKLEKAKGELKLDSADETLWEQAKKALDDVLSSARKIAEANHLDRNNIENEVNNTAAISKYTLDIWKEFVIAYDNATDDLEIANGTDGKEKITAEKMNNDREALERVLADMGEENLATKEIREKLKALIAYVKDTYKASDDEYDENVVYYTSETWAKLMTELDAAEKAVNDVDSTEKQLDDAYKALDAAKKALIKSDVQLWKEAKAALEAEIGAWTSTYGDGQQDYSGATWNAFEKAYVEAFEYLEGLGDTTENPTAETSKMTELTNALKAAGVALTSKTDAEKAADKAWEDLNATLGRWTEKYENGIKDYTTDSWKAFTAAYDAAKGTIDAGRSASLDKTAEALKKLNDALENAGNALKTKDEAFKEAWDALKASYDANTEKYNATSKAYVSGWDEFKAAYEAAGTALAAAPPYEPGVTTEILIELKTKLDAAAAPEKLVAKTEEQLGKEALDEAWGKLAGALETYKPKHDAGANAYTAGWEAFDKAYTAADNVINVSPYEPDMPTVAGLTKLYNDLVAAAAEEQLIAKTAEQLDKEALDEAWADLAGTVETLKAKHDAGADAYTAGWELFDKAYTDADKVINGTPYEPTGLTVAGLTLLRTNLLTAEKGLKEKTEDELAQEALDKAWTTLAGTLEELKDEHDAGEAMYSAGWEAFDTAYKMADNVINVNPYEPTMPTVDLLKGYNDALVHAADNLVKKTADEIAKDELDKVIDEAEDIIKEGQKDYTDESWKNLEDAVEDAKNPPENAKAEDFKELQDAVQDAMDNLQTKEEAAKEEAKKNLDAAVEAAKPIIDAGQGNYTDDSWNAFVDAYEKAKNPSADATAEELKQLQDALEAAKAGLQTWEQLAIAEAKKNLENAVEVARPVIEAGQGNNTDDSWKAFNDAYNAAIAPSETATAEELNKLKTDLETAQNALTVKVTVTQEEQQIMDLLGVTQDVAREILQIMAQYNIPLDTLAITEQMILNMKTDDDIKGSTFGLLQLRSVKETNKTVKVKWKKVKGADGYLLYGNKCGKSYELLKNLGANKTNYTQKKLKKGTYYKYLVVAYKNVGGVKVTLGASKTIHTVTKGGNHGVAKAVTVKPGKVNLKVKKSKKVKATEVKKDKPIKPHRKVSFESSKPEVATVNKKGKIKALKKGSATIYAYAQNGVFKKINVKVK